MASDDAVRIGGLMRCCLASLGEHMDTGARGKEGDTLHCRYCKNEEPEMRFRAGAWEWNRPEKMEWEHR